MSSRSNRHPFRKTNNYNNNNRSGNRRKPNDTWKVDRAKVEPQEPVSLLEGRKIDEEEIAEKGATKFYPPNMKLEDIYWMNNYMNHYKGTIKVLKKLEKEYEEIVEIYKQYKVDDKGGVTAETSLLRRCPPGKLKGQANDLAKSFKELDNAFKKLYHPNNILIYRTPIYNYLINGTNLLGDLDKVIYEINFNIKEYSVDERKMYGPFPPYVHIDSIVNFKDYNERFSKLGSDIENKFFLKIQTM